MSAPGSWLKLLLIGLGTGFLAGLMGVGGGVVMIPAMVLLLKIDQHTAHGTSLAIMIVIAASAAAAYALNGAVDWPIAATLIPGTLAGAFVGARLASRVPARQLTLLFSVFVIITGATMVHEGIVGAEVAARAGVAPHAGIVWGLVVGLLGGCLGGLLGVGGGIIMVPALALGPGLAQQVCQGTSLVAIIATAISGALTHNAAGHMDRRAAIGLAAGGLPGSLAGASVANSMPGAHLTATFGVFLIVMSALIAYPALRAQRGTGR